eukprot:8628736-Ditylum_brightwellii.AAC.1
MSSADTSQSGKDKVSYKDLNAFVNARVTAALNKAKKKQKKEKEVIFNVFNKFCSLNVESSGKDKEGKLRESAPATDSNSDNSDSNSNNEASRILSNDSNSNVSA